MTEVCCCTFVAWACDKMGGGGGGGGGLQPPPPRSPYFSALELCRDFPRKESKPVLNDIHRFYSYIAIISLIFIQLVESQTRVANPDSGMLGESLHSSG